jgi:hypothetical protein
MPSVSCQCISHRNYHFKSLWSLLAISCQFRGLDPVLFWLLFSTPTTTASFRILHSYHFTWIQRKTACIVDEDCLPHCCFAIDFLLLPHDWSGKCLRCRCLGMGYILMRSRVLGQCVYQAIAYKWVFTLQYRLTRALQACAFLCFVYAILVPFSLTNWPWKEKNIYFSEK